MRFPVSASQQKTAAVKGLDVGLLVLLAALIFFLVATTANGLFPGDLGSWVDDSLALAPCLGGRHHPVAPSVNSRLLTRSMRLC